MGNHLPGGYDVGRLEEENFKELLNTIPEILKFDNVEN
jgi:hypothetical protein